MKMIRALLIGAGCFFFNSCDFEIPLTVKPTRTIDSRLLGDWVFVNVNAQKIEYMNVRKLDDSTYVVSSDGELYRAYHSDFAGTAFLSVQELTVTDGKYLYMTYQVSADGTKLGLKSVNTKVIPETTKGQAALQELIKQNLANPKLFDDEVLYTRKKFDK
jgi:hypothetical protein